MPPMFFSCWIFLLLFSCNSGNKGQDREGTGDKAVSISFEKLDSIQIDFLGIPVVHDIDPSSRKVLFMDNKEFSPEIHVADFEGKILASFLKSGDSPDSYGGLMSTLRIRDENTFLVYGYNGFMVYDFEGTLKSQVMLDDFEVPSTNWINMGFGMEKLGNRYVYINLEKPPFTSQEFKEFQLLSWLNPENGEKEPFIQFPESSVFRNGNYFFPKSWFPVYTLEEGRIHIVFGSDPVIYEFEKQPPYSLISTIPLNLPDYSQFKGSDHPKDGRLFGMGMISGRIENIKKIGGFFIVAYFPGYNSLDTEAHFENKSLAESTLFRERMQKKYPARIGILDSLGNLINDFVPEGLVANSMLIRNGELWMQEKPDEEVERDYFRLFRVGLKVNEPYNNDD
ncbi:protein of unknown function [Cyclobacterium lianum]|uniref:6-bladed beta-propeller protein n=1 Tax=Cyclobacterium lianum TaxID=388280 RepID=A0A1M7Q4L1_9BACT|nr:hypothetical protein [Cyclobacterium lianum]SHN25271.1 protein of unknown function [Cyclobacterium lianum]